MIVLIGSDKGGSGKTTIATNLAAMRASAEKEVLLLDSDKLNSATNWADLRQGQSELAPFTCLAKMGKSAGLEIVKLRDKFDDIIVDAGGRDSLELRMIMMIADQMVVPVRPSQFDVWSLSTIEDLVNDARALGNENLMPLICLNLADPNPLVRESEEVLEFVREFDVFQVNETPIHDRIAFRHAAREGRAVFELNRGDTNKAVTELTYLYERIFP